MHQLLSSVLFAESIRAHWNSVPAPFDSAHTLRACTYSRSRGRATERLRTRGGVGWRERYDVSQCTLSLSHTHTLIPSLSPPILSLLHNLFFLLLLLRLAFSECDSTLPTMPLAVTRSATVLIRDGQREGGLSGALYPSLSKVVRIRSNDATRKNA